MRRTTKKHKAQFAIATQKVVDSFTAHKLDAPGDAAFWDTQIGFVQDINEAVQKANYKRASNSFYKMDTIQRDMAYWYYVRDVKQEALQVMLDC